MTLPSVLGCQVCSALEKQNVPRSKVFFGAKCASALHNLHYNVLALCKAARPAQIKEKIEILVL